MDEEKAPLIATYHGEKNNCSSRKTPREKLPLRVRLYVFVSHFLSAWGDRMWSFGVGLYMVELEPQDLRLVAIFGFASAGAVLFFGAIVGDWVDSTQRLTAARWTLVVQNMAVAVCSVLVYFVFLYYKEVKTVWPNEGLAYLCYTVIIIIAVVSNLASVANTIAVERDWVVEICGRDSDLLADMTSKLRSIDLTTLILAPAATGQVMAFAGIGYGALFIAGWNVVSVVIEYYFIWKVYDVIPALKRKKSAVKNETRAMKDEYTKYTKTEQKCGCCQKAFASFITLKRGWKTYMNYDVAFAGLGLASLYMTVLGFDNITVGYSYSQGISESLLGVLMAVGALVGILSTAVYPTLRRTFGLQRTGLFGLSSQIVVLSLCVVSVWAPGSPFDLSLSSNDVKDKADTHNTTTYTTEANHSMNRTSLSSDISDVQVNSYVSIILLLAGIVGARFGLWIADLTITQLFLETVVEEERGVVNGVQSSLNQLMDMLKFLMVILAPRDETFGLLVLISFGFVCLGLISYAKYSKSVRGHLFHWNKLFACCR